MSEVIVLDTKEKLLFGRPLQQMGFDFSRSIDWGIMGKDGLVYDTERSVDPELYKKLFPRCGFRSIDDDWLA